MERNPPGRLFYLPAGVIAPLVLGMALTPLREMTHTGNFVFVFVILVVVVGNLGGRSAAVAAAACSALSLNFFLTRPYLSLRIHDRDDVIAFAGLLACGLVAAALGARRPPD
jgi:K+-sensing histidine kinase KdpD